MQRSLIEVIDVRIELAVCSHNVSKVALCKTFILILRIGNEMVVYAKSDIKHTYLVHYIILTGVNVFVYAEQGGTYSTVLTFWSPNPPSTKVRKTTEEN